jgi:probable rRNA maturation factor
MSFPIEVDVANRQTRPLADLAPRAEQAARLIVAEGGWPAAQISLVVVADEEMRQLNRQHLQHDYTTDVLSFVLDDSPEMLIGEIVVCSDVAHREGARRGASPDDELLLYVVHGLLHLIGFRDKTPSDRTAMRAAEQYWLTQLGVPEETRLRLEVDAEGTAYLGEQLR